MIENVRKMLENVRKMLESVRKCSKNVRKCSKNERDSEWGTLYGNLQLSLDMTHITHSWGFDLSASASAGENGVRFKCIKKA